ncbi:cell division protein FtsZ [Weeksellaceae bacterium TAE3-ERU29]|nr:cell division protein FtsZ [Weeksellaceae bacterium TAE3-ERU29]
MDFNNISFEMPKGRSAAIKVIGVGGGGSNAVNYMYEQGITGVDFIVTNTDAQALAKSEIPVKIQLGASITEGLGAGANPEVGEQAALETLDEIKAILDNNTKMVFITAGMGGGTGTGAAPIIAKCAKEMGILTVGICTAPFNFEGKKRLDQAKAGIEKLRTSVDSLIIINNDKLRELYGNLGYKTGFAKADEVLATAAKGIAEVITHEYSINIDLRDAKTVLADSGTAIMGSAKANGADKAKKAIQLALDSPLLNDNKITGAKNVLLLIVSGEDEVTMDEIGIINDYIQEEAGYDANIIMGMGEDPELGENISVTIVATGFPQDQHSFSSGEKQTIIHKLEDFDVFSKKEEKEETPSIKKEEEKKEVSFEYSLSDTEEEEEVENEYIFKIKNSDEGEVEDISFEEDKEDDITPQKSEKSVPRTPEAKETNSGYTLFTLDEAWEEEETPRINKGNNNQPKNQVKAQEKEAEVEVEEKPKFAKENYSQVKNLDEVNFDAPISSNLSEQIKERRERLKKFNFKFKNSLQETNELESVPAYKRQGMNLSEHSHSKPGNYIVDEDINNEVKIRPNNFLHDNVD